MTGAVKEEILARTRELGCSVVDGEIVFDSLLVRPEELLDSAAEWTVPVVGAEHETVHVPAGSLGLTLCQVPIVVSVGDDEPYVEVEFADGRTERRSGQHLAAADSASVFGRTGKIRQIRAVVPEH